MPLDLLGNHTVRARLAAAAAGDRLHHCYLFEGPEGVGKAKVALQLALDLNCEVAHNPGPSLFGLAPPPPRTDDLGAACGTCPSCHLILAGTHPDVIRVGPPPEKSSIGADQARELIGALSLQRHSARRRVVIVDPADALTEEAANALLKTLEEPPPQTLFVLVTARAGSLLQTVRSRSQRVRFGAVPREELEAWLRQRGLDPAYAGASMGSPGVALRLAEGEGAARREVAEALLGVITQPLPRLFAFAEASAKKADGGAERTETILQVLEELLRDVALVGAGRPERVLHVEHLPQLRRWASLLWPQGLGRMERAVAAARDRLRLNVNGRIVVESLVSTLNLELALLRPAA